MNAFDSTLSLCMRARRLTFGLDTVRNTAARGEVFLLLTASDLSPKTVKEVEYLSSRYHIPCCKIARCMEEVANIIGKKTGVIGITDEGFSNKLMLIHNETEDHLCR
ncbi:MAG: L7Ae/L30e/S12e/Gadd45 family ribosomal protein [Candidatus Merdivicinus sp.]